MSLARNGMKLWFNVAQHLEQEIAQGDLAPGARLPTEPELAERFNVSRNTIRRAMATLEERGLVRIEQGRGTFVHERPVSYNISRRTRFSQNLRLQGLEPAHELLRTEVVPATEQIAHELQIEINDPVIYLHSRMKADGSILSINEAFYPYRRFPGLADKRAKAITMTDVLKEYGINDYSRLKTVITSRPPTDEEARLLEQPRSRWVICTQKLDVDEQKNPIVCSSGVWAADLVRFTIGDEQYS